MNNFVVGAVSAGLTTATLIVAIAVAAVTEDGRNIRTRERVQVACIQAGKSVVHGDCLPLPNGGRP